MYERLHLSISLNRPLKPFFNASTARSAQKKNKTRIRSRVTPSPYNTLDHHILWYCIVKINEALETQNGLHMQL